MPLTIANKSDLAVSLTAFWKGAARSSPHHETFKSMLRQGRNFVCSADGTRTAPSRFVGYRENTFVKHVDLDRQDGGVMDAAITRVLGARTFVPDLEEAYRRMCASFGIVPSKT